MLSAGSGAIERTAGGVPPGEPILHTMRNVHDPLPFERVVVVRGINSRPGDHWFPWLMRAVPAVEMVDLPDPAWPDAAAWISAAAETIGSLSPRTAVVTHSLGGITGLRAVQLLAERWAGSPAEAPSLGAFVAVAPFASTLPDTGEDHLDRFIASGLGGFLSGMAVPNPRVFGKATVIHSDDDRLVPPAKSEEFAAAIGARTVVVPGAGHFLASDGVTDLPEVVDALRAAGAEKRP